MFLKKVPIIKNNNPCDFFWFGSSTEKRIRSKDPNQNKNRKYNGNFYASA